MNKKSIVKISLIIGIILFIASFLVDSKLFETISYLVFLFVFFLGMAFDIIKYYNNLAIALLVINILYLTTRSYYDDYYLLTRVFNLLIALLPIYILFFKALKKDTASKNS